VRWEENGQPVQAEFVSLRGGNEPRRAVAADDTLTADAAFRLVSQGTAIVWRGDFVNARQLLAALGRRVDGRLKALSDPERAADSFHAWRQVQAQRANMLSLLLVPVTGGTVSLPRAPDVAQALAEAVGGVPEQAVMPLRDLVTALSAAEWQRKGVPIAALGGAKIHPRFGVFPPTRQDYVALVAGAPLPPVDVAFDLGTGSGVLAAVLLHRGVKRVMATDISPAAVASAGETFAQLEYADRAAVVTGRLYPEGRAALIVCNPPWLPGKAGTALESAVYDPDSAMLRGFLDGLRDHLLPGGEGWLIISDLAEHLGLRAPGELQRLIAEAGLTVVDRLEAPPASKGAHDAADPLHFARSKEIVRLWRLRPA
jgi:methylase of polypeptide subunit release factors